MNRPRPRQRTPVEAPRLIAFHKPPGVLSQWTDDPHWPGLARHLHLPGFYPAGRLDHDSEGLLLLTNDGALRAHLTRPDSGMPKTYLALVEGQPHDDALGAFRAGLMLSDGPTRPAAADPVEPPDWRPTAEEPPGTWLRIILTEGRNRQVRRMARAIGHPVHRLIRWSVGSITLADLAPGAWREVSPPAPPRPPPRP
ncbi:MAG: pseudouridine synthase [Rhodobacteraceae bacterium]|nr:pseudouridine synthase [Paracoccaceae bacterium]